MCFGGAGCVIFLMICCTGANKGPGHSTTLLKHQFMLWRRTPWVSMIEFLAPIAVIGILMFVRSQIDHDILPSVEFREIIVDDKGDLGYTAVYHYPLVERPGMSDRQEEEWMEDVYGFAGIIPRSRLFFIPQACFWTGNFATQRRLVGLTPRNDLTESIASQIDGWRNLWKGDYGYSLDLDYKFFKSKEEMFDYVEHPEYMKDIKDRVGLCFGITYSEETDGDGFTEYKFELHFDDQEMSKYKNIPSILKSQFNKYNNEPDIDSFYLHTKQGFNMMQNWCANALLRSKLYNLDASIISMVKPMQTNEFVKDDFIIAQQVILPLFMIVVFLLPIYRFINVIVSDRSNRTKDQMRSLGIKESAYWCSWLLWYSTWITMVTTIQATMLVYGVFQYSDFASIFTIVFTYGLSLFGYIVIISSFFARPTVASIVGSLLFFMSSFVDLLVQDSQMDEHYKLIASILPSIAIQRCFLVISELEKQQQGLTMSNLSTRIQNYRIDFSLVMMCFFLTFFSFLGIYITNILPHVAGGFREHPCFCLGANHQQPKPKRRYHDDDEDEQEKFDNLERKFYDFEKVYQAKYEKQKETGNVLKIRDLTKCYKGDKRVVDNLNVNMYSGEIFALLGHNGAGKTTTIKMIIGELESTSGRMIFRNKNLAVHRKKLQHKIGVCPQDNILYDTLTVLEHFELFEALRSTQGGEDDEQGAEKEKVKKNMSQRWQEIKEGAGAYISSSTSPKVSKLIEALDLSDQREVQARYLSGGQKRKLQVGLAFVGDSNNIVLLDEPTAGLDIVARRHIWDFLKEQKSERVIILTTHYMDEAEILGDCIGIMSQGKLVCQGSSSFLARRFGTGSQIKLQTESSHLLQELMKQYNRRVGQDIVVKEIEDCMGPKTAIELPYANSQMQLAPVLRLLEENTEKLGISSKEINQTTLEQVFIQVQKNQNKDNNEEELEKKALVDLKRQISEELVINRKSQCCKHAYLNVNKRAKLYCRSLKTFMLEIIIPIILILTGFNLAQIQFFFQQDAKALSPSLYGDSVEQLLVNRKVINPPEEYELEERSAYILTKDEPKQPDGSVSIWDDLSLSQSIFTSKKIRPKDFQIGPALGDQHLTSDEFVAALPQSRKSFDVKYLNYSNTDEDVGFQGRDIWKQMEKDVYQSQFDDLLDDADMAAYGSYFLYEMNNSTKQFKVASLVNITQSDSAALYPQFMYQSIIKLATGDPKIIFSVLNSPLPIPQDLREQEKAASNIFLVFVITISYALMQASIIAFVCHEKERKLKQMQFIQGMSRKAYWIVNFTFDLIKTISVSGFILLMIKLNDLDFPEAWTILIEFPFAIVPFTYATSFLFSKESTAQNCTIFFHLIFGSIASSSIFIMRLIEQTEDQGDMLNNYMKVVPSYALSSAMLYSSSKKILNESREYSEAEIFQASAQGTRSATLDRDAALDNLKIRTQISLESFDIANMGGDIYALAAHAIIGLLILIIIEAGICRCRSKRLQNRTSPNLENNQPPEQSKNKLINVDGLQKVYTAESFFCCCKKTTKALINTSFEVAEHQCFSLIGENGAGKSTIYKIITGEEVQTKGVLELIGLDSSKNMSQIFQEMGYCPQDCVLFDSLTVEEHLDFYAKLRCLENRKAHIESIIITLSLQGDRKKESQQLSGGNKRKLSVGIALIAKPRLILLDEPSTGVDPFARKHMWNTIGAFQQTMGQRSSAILLTTHSMEEAETLSSKLAIMTKGGVLECQGTNIEIKNDQGKSFTVDLSFKSVKIEEEFDESNAGLSTNKKGKHPIRYEIFQQAIWSEDEIIQLLENRDESQLATQIQTSGILCPQGLRSGDNSMHCSELWIWFSLNQKLLQMVFSLLEDKGIKEIAIEPSQEEENLQQNQLEFRLRIEKATSLIGSRAQDRGLYYQPQQTLTCADLIVKLSKFRSLLSFQVNETTLEQIVLQTISKKPETELDQYLQENSLRFTQSSLMHRERQTTDIQRNSEQSSTKAKTATTLPASSSHNLLTPTRAMQIQQDTSSLYTPIQNNNQLIDISQIQMVDKSPLRLPSDDKKIPKQ